MAHKTLISGTAYEVTGGKCLVGGTGYSIQKGRTLVNGTGYDVEFSSAIAVTITGTGDSISCYVEINGTKYTKAYNEIEVEAGDIITFTVGSVWAHPATLKINGTTMISVDNNGSPAQYNWTVPSVSAVNIALDVPNGYGTITVTTS